MLKKISQKFFFIFCQLQQTPTWVVYKNSNHLPGFQIKHEKAATTYSKHTAASTYQINIFSMIFSTNVSSFFSQIAANTYLKMIWKKRKQQPPTLKHRLAITIQGFFFCFIFKEVIAARQDWMHLRSKKIFITEMIQDYCHVKCHYHHKYRSWGEAEKQRKLFYSKNRSLG